MVTIDTVRKITSACPIEQCDEAALGVAASDAGLTTCENHLDAGFMALLKSGAHADFANYAF